MRLDLSDSLMLAGTSSFKDFKRWQLELIGCQIPYLHRNLDKIPCAFACIPLPVHHPLGCFIILVHSCSQDQDPCQAIMLHIDPSVVTLQGNAATYIYKSESNLIDGLSKLVL